MINTELLQAQRNQPWRIELRQQIKNKDRVAIERTLMNELDPLYRSTCYEEVNQGLTYAQALTEAKRCLDCPKPTCMEGCPVEVNIPGFIKLIEINQIVQAAQVLKEASALPAVCGRVCPQEKQCESHCIHHKMNSQPVAIGYLERFAADYERDHLKEANIAADSERNVSEDTYASAFLQRSAADKAPVGGTITIPTLANPNHIKIAVAGSGPAGLSFAGDMAKAGYQVTVFEALHEIGGVLKYGIPAFRLPNYIVDVEVDTLRQMGVTFVTNCIIGKTISYEQLLADGFQGIFVATGAGLPNFMHIKGENLNGILSSNEYLTRVNLMNANHPMADTPVFRGKHVAVIGGGNTAMDSVRTAKRLGAETAMIVYRRSENEMPARIEEIKHAKEEGVIFMNLYNPIEYEGDQYGHVNKMLLQRMQLGEPDSSGRRKPEIIPGCIETIEVDMVVVAVGVSPNPLIPNTFKGLDVSSRGTVIIQQDTLRTSLHNVYAGGDIVRGGATVILAMGDGRKAAEAMKKALEK